MSSSSKHHRPSCSLSGLFASAVVVVVCACWLGGCGPALISGGSPTIAAERHSIDAGPPAGRRVSFLRAVAQIAPDGPDPDQPISQPAGPRLIFVHGTPGDATQWVNYLRTPVAGLETIAVDRLGFGSSVTVVDSAGKPVRSAITDYATQAQTLLRVVNAAPDRPILIGHSLGGPIIAMMAALEPERIGGLVILAGTLDPKLEEPAWYNYMAEWLVFSWLLSDDLRIANHEVLAAGHENSRLAYDLSRIRCPVVVVQGGKDQLVPAGHADYIKRTLIGAAAVEIILLPDAGHFLPWQHEATVRQAIERVLELGHAGSP